MVEQNDSGEKKFSDCYFCAINYGDGKATRTVLHPCGNEIKICDFCFEACGGEEIFTVVGRIEKVEVPPVPESVTEALETFECDFNKMMGMK